MPTGPVIELFVIQYQALLSYSGGVVLWMSHQQSTVTSSSTHAEYIATAKASKELTWLCHLLSELQEDVLTQPLCILIIEQWIYLCKIP